MQRNVGPNLTYISDSPMQRNVRLKEFREYGNNGTKVMQRNVARSPKLDENAIMVLTTCVIFLQ